MNPPAPNYRLAFADDFDSPELDRSKWLPLHLPQWSSRAAAAARYSMSGSRIELTVAPGQPAWCPEFDGATRVSSLQTGLFAGPFGSPHGQVRFNPALRVREEQPTERLYVPRYGYFEMRARMQVGPGQLAAFWMPGFEERPEQSGEICIMEIFGDSIAGGKAGVGHGIKPIHDPSLRSEFFDSPVQLDPGIDHIYAAEWTPDGVRFLLDGIPLYESRQSPDYAMQLMVDVYELRPEGLPPPVLSIDWVRGWTKAG